MNIQWNNDQTLGKSKHAYYKLSRRYCGEPGVEEQRWFAEYQPGAHTFDPTGTLIVIEHPHGFKTKEEAMVACEKNAEYDLKHL
jgi:hypothetical protein